MKTKFIRFATGIMAFILCMAVFTGLTGVSLAAESAEGTENRLPLFVDNGLNNAYTMEVGDVVAARFETTDVIAAVNIDVKRVVMSAGQPKMTASVYRWTDTYEDTLKTTPLISETIKDLKNNTTYRVEADSALPAGEYLVVCSSTGGKWNLGKYYSDIGGISWYKNGASDSYAYSIAVESAKASNTLIAGASDASSLGARPDTWVAVDGLGRTLSDYEAVGGEKADKQVGIFYWTGSGRWGQSTTAYNITERLNSVSSDVALAARNDYEHSLWQTDSAPSWFWDEPLFGYYTTNDDYVVRKHAEMLADAGVDVIFFDCCVGLDNTSSYMNVFEIFAQARKEGVNTPDIAFMLPMGDAKACATYLRRLYEQIYSQGLYEDLWYYFDGKPLILAYKDQLNARDDMDREIIQFFKFRRADAWSWRTEDFYSNSTAPFWGWLSTFPQAKYFIDGKLEQITVGVAQNVDVIEHKPTAMNGTNVAGRSYVYGDYSYSYVKDGGATVTVTPGIENSVYYGLNFQQQWDYAIEADPEFIFVTGWNEWTVGRNKVFEGIENGFADQYDVEHSRDVEPSAGVLKDYYYYQLVENIRRFKGVSEPTTTEGGKSIDINGDLSQWTSVEAYDHYVGNTYERNDSGFGYTYTNNTMRNDIVQAKVTCDAENLYFYVKTVEDLTAPTDPAWMRLLLDTASGNEGNNWEGFEYIINRQNGNDGTCTVERLTGADENGIWLYETVGTATYTVRGNVLQMEVSRELLGLTHDELNFNFKWSDNMQTDGDIMDFYQNGDVAPGGRFCFAYTNMASKQSVDSTETEGETTDEVETPADSETNEVETPAGVETSNNVPDTQANAGGKEERGCSSVLIGFPVCMLIAGAAVLTRKRKHH